MQMVQRMPKGRMGAALAALSTLLGLLLLLSGCGQSAPDLSPPKVKYGVDVCVQCSMPLDDPRRAAAYRTKDGTARLFESIGDMILYNRDKAESVAVFYVHDYNSKMWTDATTAFYVLRPNHPVAMGDGLVAFARREDAEALSSKESGRVLPWSEVVNLAIKP